MRRETAEAHKGGKGSLTTTNTPDPLFTTPADENATTPAAKITQQNTGNGKGMGQKGNKHGSHDGSKGSKGSKSNSKGGKASDGSKSKSGKSKGQKSTLDMSLDFSDNKQGSSKASVAVIASLVGLVMLGAILRRSSQAQNISSTVEERDLMLQSVADTIIDVDIDASQQQPLLGPKDRTYYLAL